MSSASYPVYLDYNATTPIVPEVVAVAERVPAHVVGDGRRSIEALVDEVNQERGKVKVMVSIFGRATPVELDFLQVQPV